MKATHVVVMMMGLAMAGCPDSKTPAATEQPEGGGGRPGAVTAAGTAAGTGASPSSSEQPGPRPTVALKGGWTVHVTSEARSVSPAAIDTPEKKAKVLFDHFAQVQEGRVQVEHKTLSKSWPLQDDQQAVALDRVMTSTDWDKMKLRCSFEGAIAGGTIFTFVVGLGDKQIELRTGNLDAYPELKTIVETLKSVAGMP